MPLRVHSRRAVTLSVLLLSAFSVAQAAPHATPENSTLYIASIDSRSVLGCDGATGATLTSLGTGIIPVGLAVGPDHNLYVASYQQGSIQRFSASTGKSLGAFIPARRGRLDMPLMIVFGPDRNVYVGNAGNGDIRRYDGRTGAFLGVFVKHGDGGLAEPGDMAFGPDGNIYVINHGGPIAPPPDEVLRFNGRTGAPIDTFVRAGGQLTEPNNLAFGPDGSLYVGGPTGVLQFDGKTGAFIRVFAAHDEHLGSVGGLAFGPDGDLYVSDWQKSDVVKYDGRTGAFLNIFAPPSRLGLSGVFGLASRCIAFGPHRAGGAAPIADVAVGQTGSMSKGAASEVVGAGRSPEPSLLAVGTTAPDFTAEDRDGKPVRLSDFRGKTVILDFWATWCGPCLLSLPHTNEVARRFASGGVVVLAVNVRDTQERFNEWLTKTPKYDAIAFVHDWSPKFGSDRAKSLYHVSGIPVQYVIDPAGKIAKITMGYGLPTTELADALTETERSQ